MSDVTMTDIDKLAEELAAKVCAPKVTPFDLVATAARLGILEGERRGMEKAAVIAETCQGAPISLRLRAMIVSAIRSAL